MNRVLLADVILTLSAEQASRLLACVVYAVRSTTEPAYRDLLVVLRDQCAKQGLRS